MLSESNSFRAQDMTVDGERSVMFLRVPTCLFLCSMF